jgi:hypothetical protein
MVDPRSEQSDLHLGGTGIAFMLRILGNDLGLVHGVTSCFDIRLVPEDSGRQSPLTRKTVGEPAI